MWAEDELVGGQGESWWVEKEMEEVTKQELGRLRSQEPRLEDVPYSRRAERIEVLQSRLARMRRGSTMSSSSSRASAGGDPLPAPSDSDDRPLSSFLPRPANYLWKFEIRTDSGLIDFRGRSLSSRKAFEVTLLEWIGERGEFLEESKLPNFLQVIAHGAAKKKQKDDSGGTDNPNGYWIHIGCIDSADPKLAASIYAKFQKLDGLKVNVVLSCPYSSTLLLVVKVDDAGGESRLKAQDMSADLERRGKSRWDALEKMAAEHGFTISSYDEALASANSSKVPLLSELRLSGGITHRFCFQGREEYVAFVHPPAGQGLGSSRSERISRSDKGGNVKVSLIGLAGLVRKCLLERVIASEEVISLSPGRTKMDLKRRRELAGVGSGSAT